jgi:hypothetical protein
MTDMADSKQKVALHTLQTVIVVDVHAPWLRTKRNSLTYIS